MILFYKIPHHEYRNKPEYIMAVGTGGAIAPPIFCQPKKIKSLKITTYKSVYSNKDKIGF